MKNCFYDRETNSIADLIPAHEMLNSNGMIISRINVPQQHRGKGHGTALLKQIMAEADKERLTLFLEIVPSGPLDYNALKAWYERYGFKELNMYPGLFRRRAQIERQH